MSTRDEIAHAVDLFGSAMHDLAITHYKGEVTEKDLAVYTRRRLELINLFAPPAPGEVRLTLTQETAQRLIRILEPVQDAALRDATYDMDTWLACQDVMTQIDGQTHLTFTAAPGDAR